MRTSQAGIRISAAGGWALALAVAAATLPPSVAGAEVVNRIVATVDGAPITLFELQQFRTRTEKTQPPGTQIDSTTLLDGLITEKLVEREALDKGIGIGDQEVDHYVKSIKERNKLDDAQLATALEAQGLTIPAYREQVRREIQRQQLINREIRGKVNVTPEEVDRYFLAHPDEYSGEGGYEVAHIVIAVAADASNAEVVAAKAKADEVYTGLRKGADFGETAKRYSQDTGTANDGGVLGWFKKGELVESLEQVANKLDVGEISEPVRGPKGFHILKLLDRRSNAEKPTAEQAEAIKEKLYAEALDARFTEWLKTDLRQRHHVEILP